MNYSLSFFIVTIFIFFFKQANSQPYIIRDIKSFGAKGNGKANDNAAFEKAAAFFNERGGNGKLIISAGIYIIGKQTFTGGKSNKPAYEMEDVLHFKNIKKMLIEGSSKTILKYEKGLRFGAFDPQTGSSHEHGNNSFVNPPFVASMGYCIFFDRCSDISVSTLTLDGNSNNIILGGIYGDVGRQIPHYGIFIQNSFNVVIQKVNVHHFALDGICIANDNTLPKNNIKLLNCVFEYNARQGLSWVGGNELYVKNCKFNHTGKGKFESAPRAGVDIEAENGPIRNGLFEDCEFIDNAGAGMVADSGDGADCTFSHCTFWGIDNWSIWIAKPGFTFTSCIIHGSTVHGYNSPDEKSATKFFNCTFEDKTYNGTEPYGDFLMYSDGKKRITFSGCNFIANKKKLCWIRTAAVLPEEKSKFINCTFTVNNANYPDGDFVAVIKGMTIKNCTFQFKNKDAKKKKYFIIGYGDITNVDLGENKIIYAE